MPKHSNKQHFNDTKTVNLKICYYYYCKIMCILIYRKQFIYKIIVAVMTTKCHNKV